MKKAISLILALLLCVMAAAPALAADEYGEIETNGYMSNAPYPGMFAVVFEAARTETGSLTFTGEEGVVTEDNCAIFVVKPGSRVTVSGSYMAGAEAPEPEFRPNVVAYRMLEDGSYEAYPECVTLSSGSIDDWPLGKSLLGEGDTVALLEFSGFGVSYVRLADEESAAPAEGGSELPFTDIDPNDDVYGIIKYLYDTGIMKGVSDTEFDKTMPLTRGMVVTILHRTEGFPEVTYTGRFRDVAEDAWYADGVEWAAANGIVLGYDNGNYGPNDPVTREQLAAILCRFAERKGFDTAAGGEVIGDAAQISDYAADAVKWAVHNDILRVGSGSAVRPRENAVRWEVAVAIFMFLQIGEE